ncbi:MAG: ADP-forming succinate--CoA ligase subunit beta [Acidiferrobacterales bacterium]
MNIHEYQTKELLKNYGVPVPAGRVAHTISHAGSVAEELGGSRWVVKAQIHAGGRGKGGGIKLAGSIEEVQKFSDQMIGSRLVTHQTDNKGHLVQRVLVEQAFNVKKEFYLGLIINRASQRITLIASSSGGMDIEEVARETPEKVIKEIVDPAVGLHEFQCRKVCAHIGLVDKHMHTGVELMKRFYRCFRDKDALLAEINPLAQVEDDKLVALDAKMTFDDNALFRHPNITDLRDFDEEDPKEIDASGHGLNYVALDGNVGCIVNGAGLAMATMDSITLHGGRPANFLDVGGGASPEKIANAFRIVLEDPNVKGILLNIFAGINRCDWIAKGIVQAIRDQEIRVPIVVRLAGTNVEQGWTILEESGLEYIKAAKLDIAAIKIIEVIKEKTQ